MLRQREAIWYLRIVGEHCGACSALDSYDNKCEGTEMISGSVIGTQRWDCPKTSAENCSNVADWLLETMKLTCG